MDISCRFVILVAFTGYKMAMESLLETAVSSEGTLCSVWHLLWRGDALHFPLLFKELLLPIFAIACSYPLTEYAASLSLLSGGVMKSSIFSTRHSHIIVKYHSNEACSGYGAQQQCPLINLVHSASDWLGVTTASAICRGWFWGLWRPGPSQACGCTSQSSTPLRRPGPRWPWWPPAQRCRRSLARPSLPG